MGMYSSYTCNSKLKILLFWLTVSVLMFVPNAAHAEPVDTLQDTVGPRACIRYFENFTLCIGVEILNTWSNSIEITENLTLPRSYQDRFDDNSTETENPYFIQGVKGIVGNCSYIPGSQSRVSVFRFSINGSFAESEYYNLELKWGLTPATEDTLQPMPRYTQRFNVTPFDWIDQDTMLPKAIECEGGEIDSTYDPRITSIVLPDSSICKGDSVLVYVTVHNYGSCSLKAFLNARIKEDSGLYIGFDQGVWSYYGNGVDMIFYVSPGYTYTYYFAFGPVLYDDNRGIWALNGRIDASSYQTVSLWYKVYQMRLRGYASGFQTTFDYYCSESFYVIQNTGTRRILAAVVDDESCWTNPAMFYESVVDFEIRIGEGWTLGPYTTFEQEFDVDIQFFDVGSYDWLDGALGQASAAEALRNSEYALGQGLKLGGNWVSIFVINPDTEDYSYCYTQRENHGFDIGVGLLPAGYYLHSGEGNSVFLGSSCVTMGAYLPDYFRVMECALHELCHLFGALHGDQYGPDSFGPDKDGYTYVMAGGTGRDLSPWVGWRMHTLTAQKINENNHLRKFDGAPAPEYTSGKWYGQIECHVVMNANHYGEPVYRLDSDGLYHWGYNSQNYKRFSVTDSFVSGIEQSGRVLSSKEIDAEVSYPNPGMGCFYAAYKLYWSSSHWPTGFSPSQGIKLYVVYWSWQDSDTTSSSVDNVIMVIISSRSSTPSQYYSASFEAASPTGGWKYCHNQWVIQDDMKDINLTDSTVYLLLGFRDAWSADYHQKLKVHPIWILFAYTWNSW